MPQSLSFYVSIQFDELVPVGERVVPAAFASGRGLDDSFRQTAVEIVHEHPRAPIRQSAVSGGAGDRPGIPYRSRKRDLSRTDGFDLAL